MNKTTKICLTVLAVLLFAGAAAYAVTNYGSREDPLITKSYLDEVVQPRLEQELQNQIEAAESAIRSSLPGEFTELSLSAGQTLKCALGGELLLRTGSAKALGTLADTTSGSTVADAAGLTANHLYLAAAENSGMTASGACTVLVSGSYIVG